MGAPKFKTKMSVEDYLESEKISLVRREYVNGEVSAMAGASRNHNRIARNLVAILSNAFTDSSCEAFFNDIKVRVTNSVYYYPDLVVSCEETPEDEYFCHEPVLIVEILSKSTRRVDTMEKVFAYQQIPSLQEYVVVDQYRTEVRVYRRQDNGGWITHYFTQPSDIVELQSVGLTVPLPEIYRRVVFDPNANRDDED